MSGGNSAASISVLLPVYNGEKFLREAIESVLNQTFTDFELIIVNDGSVDRSAGIIESFKDSRIRVFHQPNAGLAAALNRGISLSTTEYIARQDQDDISLPERFSRQMDFLMKNPDVALLGTAATVIDERGKETGRFHSHPTADLRLRFELLFDNPFVHSSVVFRRSVITSLGAYSTDPAVFEDYNLWSRVARYHKVANLGEPLVRYREVATGMSKSAADYFVKVKKQSIENILHYCSDLDPLIAQRFVDASLGFTHDEDTAGSSRFFTHTLEKILNAFSKTHGVSPGSLRDAAANRARAFRRRQLNGVINSKQSNFFQKLSARLQRRWLLKAHSA